MKKSIVSLLVFVAAINAQAKSWTHNYEILEVIEIEENYQPTMPLPDLVDTEAGTLEVEQSCPVDAEISFLNDGSTYYISGNERVFCNYTSQLMYPNDFSLVNDVRPVVELVQPCPKGADIISEGGLTYYYSIDQRIYCSGRN